MDVSGTLSLSAKLQHIFHLVRPEDSGHVRRDARHWFLRGLTEQNLNQTDKALRSLRTSPEIELRNPGAHTALDAILI